MTKTPIGSGNCSITGGSVNNLLRKVDRKRAAWVETLEPRCLLTSLGTSAGSQIELTASDVVRFQVTEEWRYDLALRQADGGVVEEAVLTLKDASGDTVAQTSALPDTGINLFPFLKPGMYTVELSAPSQQTYQLMLRSFGIEEAPVLLKVGEGEESQVVLRDTQRIVGLPTAVRTSDEDQEMRQGEDLLQSIPVVATHPVGLQTVPSAGAQLAWSAPSDGAVLPPGFKLPARGEAAVLPASVSGVSGSFLDPVTEAAPSEPHLLTPSAALIAELSELVEANFVQEGEPSAAVDAVLSDAALANEEKSQSEDEDQGEEMVSLTSPTTLGFGVVAGLGAVGTVAEKNRRRRQSLEGSHWSIGRNR